MEKLSKEKQLILVEYPSDLNLSLLNGKKLTFPFKSKLRMRQIDQCLEVKSLPKKISKRQSQKFRVLIKKPGKGGSANKVYKYCNRGADEYIKITKRRHGKASKLKK